MIKGVTINQWQLISDRKNEEILSSVYQAGQRWFVVLGVTL